MLFKGQESLGERLNWFALYLEDVDETINKFAGVYISQLWSLTRPETKTEVIWRCSYFNGRFLGGRPHKHHPTGRGREPEN
jgi:hypothetical protein